MICMVISTSKMLFASGPRERNTSRSGDSARSLGLAFNLCFHFAPLLAHIVIFKFNRIYERVGARVTEYL